MRNVAPKISEKSPIRSTQSAINKMSNEIKAIQERLDTKSSSGARSDSQNTPDIRLIQEGENYFIEAKFEGGWARIPQSMTLITKRD